MIFYVDHWLLWRAVRYVCLDFPGRLSEELMLKLRNSVFMYGYLRATDGTGRACYHAVATEETEQLARELCQST